MPERSRAEVAAGKVRRSARARPRDELEAVDLATLVALVGSASWAACALLLSLTL